MSTAIKKPNIIQTVWKNHYFNVIILSLILISGFCFNIYSNSQIAKSLVINSQYALYGTIIQMVFIIGSTFAIGIDLSVDYYVPVMHNFKKLRGIDLFNRLYFIVIIRRVLTTLLLFSCIYLFVILLNRIHIIHLHKSWLKLYSNAVFFPICATLISITFYYARMIRAYQYATIGVLLYQFLPFAIIFMIVTIFSFHTYSDYCLIYAFAWGISALTGKVIFYQLHKSYFHTIGNKSRQSKFFAQLTKLKRIGKFSHAIKIALTQLIISTSAYIFSIFIVIFSVLNHNQNEISYAVAIGALSLVFPIIVKAMNAIAKPKIRLLYLTNPTFLQKYTHNLFILGLSIAIMALGIIIIFGKDILIYFYGHNYIYAYPSYCVGSIGFILVEGFTVRTMVIAQLDPLYASRTMAWTNVITIILMTIGAMFSLLISMEAFVVSRIIYAVSVSIWRMPKHK